MFPYESSIKVKDFLPIHIVNGFNFELNIFVSSSF